MLTYTTKTSAPPPPGAPTASIRVVHGPLSDLESSDLQSFAHGGGVVLFTPAPDSAPDVALAGARITDVLPRTEWIVTLADRPERVRLADEVPISSPVLTLQPTLDTAEVAATTSIRFEHRPTILLRRHGAGTVITTGFDTAALRRHLVLGPFIQRLARPSFAPAATELGVAVIGYGPYGGMGYYHGLATTETEGLALVAAADTVPQRLDAARVDFPNLVAHADGTSVAADTNVDVAIVATPPAFHAGLALELLRAGKHVVVEKPMCLTSADAERLITTAQEVERTITVHQSRRWDQDWLAVRRVIAQDRIGEVFNIETFVGGFEHPCRAWHSEDSISGGAVYDWGSHHVDWILQLFGSAPQRLMCTAHTRVWLDTSNVDQLSLWMQWADGREATFRQSDVCAIRRPKFHIEGTEGTLQGHYAPVTTHTITPGRGYRNQVSHHAEAPVSLLLASYDGEHGLIESTIPPAPHPGWGFHQNLANHLLLGEPLAVLPQQSLDVVRVLEAAHRSGANGGELIELA
ncbi:MAG: Gfo/Idh/MocA family oxidoreductase [Acidimicrobiales bacterium]|nr:Gfo/Idh/MocA family oxidoreductase [Acidimicrobiales bacterium]